MTTTALPPLSMEAKPLGNGERLVRWGLVAALHGVVLYGVLNFSTRQEEELPLPSISVRLLPQQETKKQEVTPPPQPAPTRKAAPVQPQPVLAAKAAETPSSFAVAPQPPAPPPAPVAVAPAPAPAATSAPMTAARFDADYLHNPKPVYPAFSRRAGEEGKVFLRVKVSAAGTAEDIEIKQSSGFARLDNAAREAVAKWRFVPARRGDEGVESWVTVPITFALD